MSQPDANTSPHIAAYAAWLSRVRIRSPLTVAAYGRVLRRFEHVTGTDIVTASPGQVDDFLAATDDTELVRSRVQHNHKLVVLRGFFAWTRTHGLREDDPTAHVRRLAVPPQEPPSLSLPEMVRLVEAAERSPPLYRSRNVALVQVFLHTGMRVAEVARLDLDQVDLEAYRLHAVVRKGGRLFSAVLNDVAVEALEQWLVDRPRLEPRVDERALWVSDQGGRMAVRTIQQTIKLLAAQAGIARKVSPHTLRHSSATQLALLNVALPTVQSILGHSSLSTTQRYLHIAARDREDAAIRLGKAFEAARAARAGPE